MSNKTFIIIILLAIAAIAGYIMLKNSPIIKSLPIDSRELTAEKPKLKEITTETTGADFTLLEKEFPTVASSFDADSPFTIKRIWIEGEKIFVEYETVKSDLHQLLITKSGKAYHAKALFTGSEGGGWSLVKGEGTYADPSALLYEKNAKGDWIKRN